MQVIGRLLAFGPERGFENYPLSIAVIGCFQKFVSVTACWISDDFSFCRHVL